MAEWIIPSNVKYYRVDDAFRELGTVDWSQNTLSKNVAVGDTVYIYESSPVSAIRWQCVVTASHKPSATIDDGQYCIPPMGATYNEGVESIELRAVKELEVGPLLDYKRMAEHGLKSRLMGPNPLKPGPLADYIHSIAEAPDPAALVERDAAGMELAELLKTARQYTAKKPKEVQVSTRQYVRNPYIAEYAKRRANGICQLCGEAAPFKDEKGRPYLESHHIEWLSAGGADSVDNTVAICPNCHRRMHILASPEDVKKLKQANKEPKKK